MRFTVETRGYFHPGLHEGVDVRTDDFLRTKISWMRRLPNFLTHVVLRCERFGRESSAIKNDFLFYRYGRLLNINRTLPYGSLILFNCFLKKLFSFINEIRLFRITFLVLLKKFCLECSRMATRLLHHMQLFYAWRQG